MRFFANKRRAISTVITTAIMLSAVAVMGSFLVLWSNSTMASHKVEMESAFSSKMNKLNEFLIIENVWFGQSPSKFANITINNAGSVWVQITKIRLISSGSDQEFLFNNTAIAPNRSNSTEIPYEWVDDVPVDVIVTTSRDTAYRTQAMP